MFVCIIKFMHRRIIDMRMLKQNTHWLKKYIPITVISPCRDAVMTTVLDAVLRAATGDRSIREAGREREEKEARVR